MLCSSFAFRSQTPADCHLDILSMVAILKVESNLGKSQREKKSEKNHWRTTRTKRTKEPKNQRTARTKRTTRTKRTREPREPREPENHKNQRTPETENLRTREPLLHVVHISVTCYAIFVNRHTRTILLLMIQQTNLRPGADSEVFMSQT